MQSKFYADAKRGSSVFVYCYTVNTSNPSAFQQAVCTYLAEIQPETTCIKSLDSSPRFHVHMNASKRKGWKNCMDHENERVYFGRCVGLN